MNVIKSIRIVESGVEIEVHSTREFPVRGELTLLRIGDKEFTRNRHPADGSLNTLIFTLTHEEFSQLNSGDPVSLQYGRHDSGARWNFGALNKGMVR